MKNEPLGMVPDAMHLTVSVPLEFADADILVVDDTPANLHLLSALLRERGCRVRAAINGPLALQAVSQRMPDLVLLDLKMPGMDGVEVCTELKRRPGGGDVPVIFVSAYKDPHDKLRAFEAGGVDYITKPFEVAEVVARVRTHVGLRRMRAELAGHNERLETRVAERTAELCRAKEAAEAANRAKGEFLAVMSHELRTPLNAILGMGELLKLSPLNDDQRRYLEVSRRAGDGLLTIIKDLLQLADLDSGGARAEERPFSLNALLETVFDGLAYAADEKGLTLRARVADDIPARLLGDIARLRQILVNLVGNAIKFTDRGRVTVEVSLLFPGVYRFAVIDTGIGIPAEASGRIFEPFTQLDASATRRHGGTGTGLALVRSLAQLLDGEVEVTSEVGHGSRFTLTVPLKQAPRR